MSPSWNLLSKVHGDIFSSLWHMNQMLHSLLAPLEIFPSTVMINQFGNGVLDLNILL